MDAQSTKLAALGVAAVVVGIVAWRVLGKAGQVAGQAVDLAAGAVSGNNALTQSATNAAGDRVTAYEGAGVLGTVGAATNAASGGVLASVGQWIGGTVYDLVNGSATQAANQPATPGQQIEGTQPAKTLPRPVLYAAPQDPTFADISSPSWDWQVQTWQFR